MTKLSAVGSATGTWLETGPSLSALEPFEKPIANLLAPRSGPARRLDSLFNETVVRHGGRTAVFDGERSITYEELDRRAELLAGHLRKLGVGTGDLVGLWVPRSTAVYVAMLAILRVGAAYVPCDADTPQGRVETVLRDSGAVAVVTTRCLVDNLDLAHIETVLVDSALDGSLDRSSPVGGAGKGESVVHRNPTTGDLAYVIYTSGSTGQPKGVPVSHANVWAFLAAEAAIFDVGPEDCIYQGFSVAFDASIEELWLAWLNGASLVCASREMALSGSALPAALERAGVTVLSCVPTLLSMFADDIDTVRLLILGGEICPPALVERWSRPGRRIVNTYGPTETTVVATYADVTPNRPVRIGRPLPGYLVEVVADDLSPVGPGEVGELLIGGPGVTDGYLNRPELTRQKFVSLDRNPSGRWYRTGDLVSLENDGELQFHGRADDQVKIRGYRVELGEIESALSILEGVNGAAVAVHDVGGAATLIGYVVRRDRIRPLDEAGLRKRLRSTLPAYMVPARIVDLEAFPTLTSGKTDRARLLLPDTASPRACVDRCGWTSHERLVAEKWAVFLLGQDFDLESDFFDCGGHSLLATAVVSNLREQQYLEALSVVDLYQHPELRQFAAQLDTIVVAAIESPLRAADAGERGGHLNSRDIAVVRRFHHALCGLAQMLSLYPLFALMMPPYVIAFLGYDALINRDSNHQVTILVLLAVFVVLASMPVRMFLAVITKWVILGRIRPGRYRLWGLTYWRVWFVTRAIDMLGFGQLRASPAATTMARLLGARIGTGVYLATVNIGLFDMVDIADGASVGHDASLQGYVLEDGWMRVGKISVGENSRIGNRALLAISTSVGANSELADAAMLPEGSHVPDGERWSGSPAQPNTSANRSHESADLWPIEPGPVQLSRMSTWIGYSLGFAILALIPTLAAVPEALLLGVIDAKYCDFTNGYGDIWKLAVAAPFAAAGFVVVLSFLIAGAKRLAVGRLEPGLYPLHSSWAIRKWFHDSLLTLSLDHVFPLYATLYLPPWLRLMGARIGRNVEVSTAENMNPDLLTFDDGVFIADAVCLGPEAVHRGWIRLDRVHIGTGSFIGNSSVVPGGTTLGTDSLIGVMSMPPADPLDASRCGESWLGNPSFRLPARQISTDFGSSRTFKPSNRRKALRAFVEFWRIVATGTIVSIGVLTVFLAASDLLDEHQSLGRLLLEFPGLLALFGLTATLFVIAAKWVLVGTYRQRERPLWDPFVWRSELVTALHENVALNFFVQLLLGTPMIAWYLRALGTKVGKRCCIDSSQLTEFDLVSIGDEAIINAGADLQTHLFEDRVMKMSRVAIGARATVGTATVVLYDAVVGVEARIAGQSLVMKGESLPPGTSWHGVPSIPA